MQKAIIGKKVGMTQIFDETGKVIPVTVVEAGCGGDGIGWQDGTHRCYLQGRRHDRS